MTPEAILNALVNERAAAGLRTERRRQARRVEFLPHAARRDTRFDGRLEMRDVVGDDGPVARRELERLGQRNDERPLRERRRRLRG